MASGFFALLDDIAAIMDDVAAEPSAARDTDPQPSLTTPQTQPPTALRTMVASSFPRPSTVCDGPVAVPEYPLRLVKA